MLLDPEPELEPEFPHALLGLPEPESENVQAWNGPPDELLDPDPLPLGEPLPLETELGGQAAAEPAEPAVDVQEIFNTSTVQSVVVTQPLLSVTVRV